MGPSRALSDVPWRDHHDSGLFGPSMLMRRLVIPAPRVTHLTRARNPRSPSPSPSPICPGMGMGVPSPICRGSGAHPHPHPRFARIGDTAEYHRVLQRGRVQAPPCLTLRLIVQPIKRINLPEGRQCPIMMRIDDAVDYGSSSDSDSESDTSKVPSRLPARAESCILAHDLSVLHAGFGCAPSSPE